MTRFHKKALMAILIAAPILIMVGCWLFLTVNVPYWDDYGAFIKYFSEPWPERWEHLFDFHNEHRIVTTRLIADALVALGGGTFNFRAVMSVGNLIQLAYAITWLVVFRKSRFGIVAGLPVLWLLTAFIHYENSCWALCAVQNIIVVALMFFACLLFAKRGQSRVAFALSLLSGIAATFSSGGGLLVWPCLLAMELSLPLTKSENWREGLRKLPSHIKSSFASLAMLLTVGAVSTCCYLHGFPGGTTEQISDITTRILNAVLFFVTFIGGIVPIYTAALALGFVLLPIIVFLTIRYPRLKHPAIFWFMAAELATMLSAAVFRSSDPHAAVSSRYCIVSCSVFASVFFLALEQIPLPERLAKWLVCLTTAGTVVYTTAFLVLGAPLFSQRNELMRRNILTWPAHIEGLRSGDLENDSINLRKCVDRGVYNPASVLKPGEAPPSEPAPWLR